MSKRHPRSGFAMMLVLVFIVLFLGLLGVALRQTAAALRIETVRIMQIQRDEGSVHAVARALALLETGLPPTDPYVCGIDVNTSAGIRAFTVTFSTEGEGHLAVRSVATPSGEILQSMPASFAPPAPAP
jgi:hypothetical protein